jgi:hypothetical protein
VQGFRQLIDTSIQFHINHGFPPQSAYPAGIIHSALVEQTRFIQQSGYLTKDNQLAHERGLFYREIRNAWDAIVYDHYIRKDGVADSVKKRSAAHSLSVVYQRAKAMGEPRPEIIKLDPLQTQILDALAEAADIPHQRGQNEIEIPERHRYFEIHNFGPDGKVRR